MKKLFLLITLYVGIIASLTLFAFAIDTVQVMTTVPMESISDDGSNLIDDNGGT